MKRSELLRILAKMGWKHLRQGGSHEIWSNAGGTETEAIPRHVEVNELLAKKIIKKAKANP